MREVPQYIQQLGVTQARQVNVSNAQAVAFGRASQEFERVGAIAHNQAQRIAEIKASTQIRDHIAGLAKQHEADPQTLEALVSAYRSGWQKDNSDPYMAARIDAEIESVSRPYINQSYNKFQRNQDTEHMVAVTQASLNIYNDLSTMAKNAFSPIPEERQAAQQELQARLVKLQEYAQEKGSDGTYLLNPGQQMEIVRNGTMSIISGLPPEQQLETIRPSGGFDKAIGITLQNEGGLAEIDGASGAPAIYGINRKWHEKAFDEAERITNEQGEAAGRAYAAQFYKQEYWDKYGIDSLRPDQQAIVFDGVVNHTQSFSKKLIKEAQAGATPSQLLDMRREEYERLARENPKAYAQSLSGWNNRLSAFSHYTMNESLSYLAPDDRMRIEQSAMKAIEQDRALMMSDYGAWGEKHGYSPDQLREMSPSPSTASVLSKERAATIVGELKKAETVEGVYTIAQGLKEQLPLSYSNAVADLRRNGMTREQESALVIAMNAPQYTDHAQDLITYSKAGDAAINAQMTDAGMKPADIRANVVSRFMDEGYDRILPYEVSRSNAAKYVEDKKESAVALAKMYMFRNPDASMDDAIDYAFKIESDSYQIGDVFGAKVKIPKGKVAESARIEDRLTEFVTQFAERQGNKRFSKAITPVLNADENGYYFLNPLEGVVMDGDRPLIATFDQLGAIKPISRTINQNMQEMRQQMQPKPQRPTRRTDEQMTD